MHLQDLPDGEQVILLPEASVYYISISSGLEKLIHKTSTLAWPLATRAICFPYDNFNNSSLFA